MFYTDVLFSSLWLHFSEQQKLAVLDWAKRMGARDVPSLHQLEKAREFVDDHLGNPTTRLTSVAGNIFYMNDIGLAIAKVFLPSFIADILSLHLLRISPIL